MTTKTQQQAAAFLLLLFGLPEELETRLLKAWNEECERNRREQKKR